MKYPKLFGYDFADYRHRKGTSGCRTGRKTLKRRTRRVARQMLKVDLNNLVG